jgi:DNA-directed RNA polymerase specialized sigma24 family protein
MRSASPKSAMSAEKFLTAGLKEFLDLDEALDQLTAIDPRSARMVELRFFGGLTEEETAEVLKVSPRTVRRGGVWPAPGCTAS